MALIECFECEKPISDKAKSCPKCGAPNDLMPCFECGQSIRKESEECGECGAPNGLARQKPAEDHAKKSADPLEQDSGFASLRFRQPPHRRNKENRRTPFVIGLVVVGFAAYWLFGDRLFEGQPEGQTNAATPRNSAGTASGRSGSTARSSAAPAPSWANKSNAEKDQCFQAAQILVRVAEAKAAFMGQQRAAQEASEHIVSSEGSWCLEYWSYASRGL